GVVALAVVVLTLSCPAGVPELLGGCSSSRNSRTAPPCRPALAPWTTRPDVVVIFLRVSATVRKGVRKTCISFIHTSCFYIKMFWKACFFF
ncbi:hypothetical protein M5D96_004584, partial [Drosophila gunungcola]